MENKQSSKRMLAQDIGKGLCIISVIISHTMALPPLVRSIIFSVFGFAMSYFFIMSGYNYHGLKCSYGQIIWKRFKQLFIPFFVVLLVATVINGVTCMIFYDATIKDVGINFIESFISEEYLGNISPNLGCNVKCFVFPSWFIWGMFGGYVIFYAVADWALTNIKRTVLTIAGLFTFTLVFSLFENLNITPFVKISSIMLCRLIICSPFIASMLLLGSLLGKYKLFEVIKKRKRLAISTSLVAFIITTTFGAIFPFVGSFAGGHLNGVLPFAAKFGIWEVPLTFVLGFLFTYHFVNFSGLLTKIPFISKWLIFNGRNSLLIYLIHPPLSFLIRYIINDPIDPRLPFSVEFVDMPLEFKHAFIFLVTLILTDVIIFLYILIKNKIKDNKQREKTQSLEYNN